MKNYGDMVTGALQGLGEGLPKVTPKPQVNASEVTRKYAQLVESGRMPAQEASIRARMELTPTQGLGPTPEQPQGAPTNYMDALTRQPGQGLGLAPQGQTAVPQFEQVPAQRGLSAPPPNISFTPEEMDTLQKLGLAEQHRARITAQGAYDRAKLLEEGRGERLDTTEAGKTQRQGTSIDAKKEMTKAQLDMQERVAKMKNSTEQAKLAQMQSQFERKLNLAQAKMDRNPQGDPKRKELVTRMGQAYRAISAESNNIIQTPESQEYVAALKEQIKAWAAQLDDMEENPEPVRAQRPQMSVGQPQIQRANTDQRALAEQWLRNNPNHPRAPEVRAKLGQR